MEPRKKAPKNIDDYIEDFPKNIQRLLRKMRSAIRKAAPQAQETISYRIPTFTLRGYLVHFAAFKHHVSFFPTSSPMRAFKRELSSYRVSRGTIQFPLERPLPLTLVRRIVKFRVRENLARYKTKS
ncbi:MAG: hypothetical protein AUH31_01635 [Armatimonadetes bacterium 13_1_40CM_64_14]|nr:MAG: hypothetical protein AUH31_01635 [Armatimonadetes bacterium 13_1_40CM_64_14]